MIKAPTKRAKLRVETSDDECVQLRARYLEARMHYMEMLRKLKELLHQNATEAERAAAFASVRDALERWQALERELHTKCR